MSKDIITKSITDVAAIDYDSVFQEAIKIFSEQALLTKTSEEITLKDIQLAKGKSENFLASIAGMLEISHKVELLSAETLKFKRSDELNLLNKLREQFEKSATFSDRMINLCLSRLDLLESKLESSESWTSNDLAQISLIQSYMVGAIDTLNSISTGTSKLIKTERESGGRSSGDAKLSSTNISTFLSGVVEGNQKNKAVKPRKISTEELLGSVYKPTIEEEDDY